MDLTKSLNIRQKFDVVLCSQVVEHLKKTDAISLIGNIEKLAEKRIIIATTNGFIDYDHGPLLSNFDKHQSGWEIEEFRRRGYKVVGHGLKWAYQPYGVKDHLPSWMKPLLYLVSYLVTPLMFMFPRWSLFLVVYKDI